MARKQKEKKGNKNLLYFVIGALVIMVLMKSNGTETNTTTLSTIDLLNNPPIQTAECTLNIVEEEICVGDTMTGVIKDGVLKTCYVYANDGSGWKLVYTDNTGVLGDLRKIQQINILGTFTFRAICDLNENDYIDVDDCITNPDTLIVTDDIPPCPPGFDPDADNGGEDYTCGWVGAQCGGTCPEAYPLCVDMWTELAGGYAFCGCVDPNSETVHPDWKPDGTNHDDGGMPEDQTDAQDTCDYDCINYAGGAQGVKGGYPGECTDIKMMESYYWPIECCCYKDTTDYNPALFNCGWYCTENQAWVIPFDNGYELGFDSCSDKGTEVCGHYPPSLSVGGTGWDDPDVCCCFNC